MTDLVPHPNGYPIKLVRDGTPNLLRAAAGGDLFYETVPTPVAARALRQKLIEEVGEYLIEPGVDELADVVAVIAALAHFEHGTDLRNLSSRVDADPRGGFFEGMMMFGFHPGFDGAKGPPA